MLSVEHQEHEDVCLQAQLIVVSSAHFLPSNFGCVF
jgi:hypothetical protein